MMSPRSKAILNTPIPRPILLIGALLPLVAALAGAARSIKAAGDATYVRRDSFALIRQADSLNAASDRRDVLRILSGLDSSDRCRRGQTGFCR